MNFLSYLTEVFFFGVLGVSAANVLTCKAAAAYSNIKMFFLSGKYREKCKIHYTWG
jgi:hypothetical protein